MQIARGAARWGAGVTFFGGGAAETPEEVGEATERHPSKQGDRGR